MNGNLRLKQILFTRNVHLCGVIETNRKFDEESETHRSHGTIYTNKKQATQKTYENQNLSWQMEI